MNEISMFLTEKEVTELELFADQRGFGAAAAARLLLNIGLEYMGGANGTESSLCWMQKRG